MNGDPDERQIEKWRRQERVNKFLVATVAVVVAVALLAGVTFFLVTMLRPVPLLSPSELQQNFASWKGRTVQVKGQVLVIDPSHVRLKDGRVSVVCQFDHKVSELSDGETATVQGKVGHDFGLLNCNVVADPGE